MHNYLGIYVQDISRCEDTLSTFKAMVGQAPSPQLQQDISRLEKEVELYSQEKLCYEAQILRVCTFMTFLFPVVVHIVYKCYRCR